MTLTDLPAAAPAKAAGVTRHTSRPEAASGDATALHTPPQRPAEGSTVELLATAGWARLLGPMELSLLRAAVQTRQVRAGDHVAWRGHVVDHWVGVARGLVQISVGSEEGRCTAINNAGPGEWFGECALVGGHARPYDAVALRDSRLLMVPARVFHHLLSSNPAFGRHVMGMMAQRTLRLTEALEGDRLYDCAQRVARCLVALAERETTLAQGGRLRLTQAEIGRLSGVSRQRTNVALQALVRRGIVRLHRQGVCVLDLNALRADGGMGDR